jgi:hypothetical protein
MEQLLEIPWARALEGERLLLGHCCGVGGAATRGRCESGRGAAGLRSKSWEGFTAPDASPIDVVITLCDDAANEACPLWPGQPVTAHWGLPDPAAVEGPAETTQRAFVATLHRLQRRLDLLVRLSVASWTGASCNNSSMPLDRQQRHPTTTRRWPRAECSQRARPSHLQA